MPRPAPRGNVGRGDDARYDAAPDCGAFARAGEKGKKYLGDDHFKSTRRNLE